MFNSITVKARLILLLAVTFFIFLIIFVFNLYYYFAVSAGIKDLYYGGVNEMKELYTISTKYEMGIGNMAYRVLQGQISWTEGMEELKEAKASSDESWKNYLRMAGGLESNSIQRRAIESLQNLLETERTSLQKLQDILRRQDREALKAFSLNELTPHLETLIKDTDQLINWHVADTQNDYQRMNSLLISSLILMLTIFAVGLAVLIFIALMIGTSITKPLSDAVQSIDQLALGDTGILFESKSTDEIGKLVHAMDNMNNSNKKIVNAFADFSTGDLNIHVEPRSDRDVLVKGLNEMISSAKKMSEILVKVTNGDLTVDVQPRSEKDTLGQALNLMTKKLCLIIGEIQSQVSVLTTSSQEIVATVSQVAAGSSETAAAVSETATSVEELKQTAHISDEKARDVLESAEEAQKIVNNSERTLQTTLGDMGQINEKMRIISASIVKLSEHSKTIGEIIDSVNELAEQSNLLAVNAAIEASKAGEHGKGFAVVAQEIRTLAEQSKAATVQVRSILNDIQNSTSAAVLATEQGLKAVDKGVSQSSEASNSMLLLTQSITRFAQAANQIVLTSQQQLMGVDQVTVAMNNITEAASQHAEHMRQIEQAVISLNAVGESLKEIANRYNLSKTKQRREEPAKEILSLS